MPVFDTAPPVYAAQPVSATGAGVPGAGNITTANRIVIDGTPMKLIIGVFAGCAGIVALRWAGFKFNVAIS